MKSLNEPFVSIVIPIYNARNVIEDCLNSVFDIVYKNFEVIIVDDCSRNESVDFIQKNYPQVKALTTKKNSGFAASINLGIKNSCGDIVALLNMDTIVDKGWLDPMVRLLAGDTSIGIVGSKIFFSDGKTIQHAGGLLRENAVSLHIGRGEPDQGQFEFTREVDYICGASLAFRKALLDKIGMFDEKYKPLYYEDVDFAFRTKLVGKKIVYVPDSVIIHKENISVGGLSKAYYYYYHKSRLRFLFKNYSLRTIFSESLKEEMRWFSCELPVEIRGTLRKVYAASFLTIFSLLIKRIGTYIHDRLFLGIEKRYKK
nr:glycosyltransferase family 2 protein [Candidatus Omnitrophota bacterium]